MKGLLVVGSGWGPNGLERQQANVGLATDLTCLGGLRGHVSFLALTLEVLRREVDVPDVVIVLDEAGGAHRGPFGCWD